jgi:FdhD protein
MPPMTRRAAISPIRRLEQGRATTDQDLVAVEAPLMLELAQVGRLDKKRLGLLMRTPGDDEDLVLGFLHGEGVIESPGDIAGVAFDAIPVEAGDQADLATVTLAEHLDWARASIERVLPTTSACGLCGRLATHALDRRRACPPGEPHLTAALVEAIPDQLRLGQAVFDQTGGLHAAALFDPSGACLAVREDVGRHNAVDKVVGAGLTGGWLPRHGLILAVSGRVAYEIVQKAVMAGAAAVIAIGAPTDLAVAAARTTCLTLVGFARNGRFNVYAGWDRFDSPADSTRPPTPGG